MINLSDTAVTLGQVRTLAPRGGLRLVSQQWAPCGALSASWAAADVRQRSFSLSRRRAWWRWEARPRADAAVLPPNGTAWLSVTFRVLVACPSSLPVQFRVGYQESGRADTAQLAGFPDLGQVSYTGCKGSSPARADPG